MRLVFIRHGMTRGNSLRRYIGRTDEPLCGEGREQIKSRVYPPADIVICSPMRRCIETAKIIYPNQKPRIYDNLRECDFGDFEGKSYEELCGNPDYESWLKSGGALPVPNGESGEAFSRRCADAFLTAARDCANAKSAAFVVHGGTIMAIMEKYAVPQKGFYEYMQKKRTRLQSGLGWGENRYKGRDRMSVLIAVTPLFTGFILDLIIGDPYRLPHPVRLMGKTITELERALRRIFKRKEKAAGAVMAAIMLILSAAVPTAILIPLYRINIWLGAAAESVMCFYTIAAKSLKTESMKVYVALRSGDIEAARKAVSMIVGRDTDKLDEAGIIKAAVETVAENTSDGVCAPMLYTALLGAAGGFVYKAANTMDSMVGYKNEKYIKFGYAAAKIDDVLNYIPSRLTAVMMIAAAYMLGFDGENAKRIWRRDRRSHASPNAAQTESVCAGALDIELAGEAYYSGALYKKPTIGDDIHPVENEDIRRADRLMYITSWICLAFSIAVRAVLAGLVIL